METRGVKVRIVWAALVLGFFGLLATLAVCDLVRQTKASAKTLRVKGYAQKEIRSDFAIWRATVTARAAELGPACEAAEKAVARVVEFLAKGGVPEGETSLTALNILVRHARDASGQETSAIEGYELRQTVTVSSADVERTAGLSRNSQQLIKEGVELAAGEPEYYYTALESLKVEMLGEAMKNARQRAETIVASAGGRLGDLRSAEQGVFQITPVFSTEVSGYGILDTSSQDKTIKAVVVAEFGLK